MYPHNRYLFMYRDVVKVAQSTLRINNNLPPMMKLLQMMNMGKFLDWMGYGGSDYNSVEFENDVTTAAVLPLATMKAYVDFRRQGYDIQGVRYEDLVAHPLETCQRLMEACGLPVSDAQEVVKCMQHDSQKNTKISIEKMRKYCDAEVTTETVESLNRLAGIYGLPSVDKECPILDGTIA